MTKNNKPSLFFLSTLVQNLMYAFQGFIIYYAYTHDYTAWMIVQFIVFSLMTFMQAKLDFDNFYRNSSLLHKFGELLQYVQSLEKRLSDKLREGE